MPQEARTIAAISIAASTRSGTRGPTD